ncbi:hypothetical protein EYF80_045895 [Liparis tanakae]|uniref:Uncharacterized protein n=1 Tax=Liparis tanakae TaxID=230148 RepID=A0A4Z2FT16_9TELE|nr:hypothetical protein EYF80_045895 [Liparis tanakae]
MNGRERAGWQTAGAVSQKEKDMLVFTCSDWTQVSKSRTKSKHPMRPDLNPTLGRRFYCRMVEAGRGGTEVD